MSKGPRLARHRAGGAYRSATTGDGDRDEIHAADLRQRRRMAGAEQKRDRPEDGGLSGLYRGADGCRGDGRRRPPAAFGCGDHGAGRQRQDQCAERALRRDPRAAWRVLPDRGGRSRRGAVLGGALSRRQPRRGRGPPDLDDVTRLGDAPWMNWLSDAAGMTAQEDDRGARGAAEAMARQSYGKLVAFLAHRLRDVAAAEDSLAEAFAAALVDWPARGVPHNPEAWLLTVARRKAIDTA